MGKNDRLNRWVYVHSQLFTPHMLTVVSMLSLHHELYNGPLSVLHLILNRCSHIYVIIHGSTYLGVC